ncbi:phosphoglycerate mutase family protein [Polyplosphaeria fusca]|uniref:Phosphoglycerate mutase family protein n=1 Tax=Polyplosphaeria fusca TaxID=682080 RepID=A0A9P4QMV1_9PLEO|nr:phosphoglycerate mutase family protein [Polyplosphaeria fusca]
MLEVIYVVRHAFRTNWTLDPVSGIYTSSNRTPTGIPTDVPLSAHGVEQSRELADYLCTAEPAIDRIYSSPFSRCLQTLRPTTERLFGEGKAGGKVRLERGVAEFFGRADFVHPSPPDLALLSPIFPDLDQEYTSTREPLPGGEMIRELHERISATFDDMISNLDSDASQPRAALVCTHAAVMIATGRVLTGQIPTDFDEDDFQCYTAGVSKFVRRTGSATVGDWKCVLNSETSFLSRGAERGWKFNGEESFVAFPDPVEQQKSNL